MNWSHFWTALSAVAAVTAALVAISAEIRVRRSEGHSKESADAAKKSAKVAEEALRFSKEQAQREHIDRAVDKAIAMGKERGSWKKGLQSLLKGYPSLVDRNDFPELCRPFFVASGVSTSSLKEIFEALRKEGYLETIPANWEF